MIFDAVRRFLGLEGNSSRRDNEHQHVTDLSQNPHGSDLIPYRSQVPPDISLFEAEISQIHSFMEQQMRSMMGSFGFIGDSPFSGFGFGDTPRGHFPSSPIVHDDTAPPILNPRDEVLKPQFRSRSSEPWNGEDLILDEKVKNDGLGSVFHSPKPLNEAPLHNNQLGDDFFPNFGHSFFGNVPFGGGLFSGSLGPESGSVRSSSTVTIYSNYNGHKSVEKIVRYPDGRIERTVTTDDGNPNPQQ